MSLTFTGSAPSTLSESATSLDWIDLTSQLSVSGGYISGRYNTTGLYNLWFGYAVASDPLSVSGSHNTGLGTYAAFKNQGDYNTWVGSRSGFENVAGSENVGVGWSAGAQQSDARGNTSLGFQGGLNALGDGNVSVGHNANSSGFAFQTNCNIAVGSAAHATGGDSIAIGADANTAGVGSTAIGVGTTVSAANSVVIGPYVDSSGSKSLLIMPRPDGGSTTHAADEELNIYGVVRGERENSGAYAVSLATDKIRLDNQVSSLSLNQTGMELYSDKNITFLSPTNLTNPVTVTDTATFSASVVMADGMRVSLGTSVFDGPVVFNDAVNFASGSAMYSRVEGDEVVAGNLAVRSRASFGNDVAFSNNARFMGTTVMDGSMVLNDEFEVLGNVDVGGDLAVTGTTVGERLSMAGGSIGALSVADLDVTGTLKLPANFVFGEPAEEGAPSTTVQFEDIRTGVARVDTSLYVRGAATFEEDLHAADAVHSKSLYTEHVHAHKVLSCSSTVTRGTFSNLDVGAFHAHSAHIDELIVYKYVEALSNEAVVTSDLRADAAKLNLVSLSNLAAGTISVSNFTSLLSDIRNLSTSNAVVSESLVADTATFCNVKITGLTEISQAQLNRVHTPHISASNVVAESVSASAVHASNLEVEDGVKWINRHDPSGDTYWSARLAYNHSPSNLLSDLVFRSTNGTVFSLTDDFQAGVLNFTGKHRCSWFDRTSCPDLPEPGLIVSTTGAFNNLDGGSEPTMDEALPVVRLSTEENDSRAFGVIAGEEAAGGRVFRLANMVFSHGHSGDPKVILNSVGEGGMWVCDANGRVADGDLLTTSRVAGHAQRQDDDVVRSRTVAKVTGRPSKWDVYRDPVSRAECSRAFCGVVYKF